jgi:hypothetical protein
MAGHLGAAVVAGYFFGEDHQQLDSKVYAGIEGELNRILCGEESIWFNPKKAGVTIPELFEPFAEETPQEGQIATIAQALSRNIDKTRQSGHNVIFAATAIRALRDHPAYATPSIVAGIRKLIEGFRGATAGRGYYGKQRGWMQGESVALPDDDEGFPPYADQQAMVDTVIDELTRSATLRRRGFGGLVHIINHAAALLELSLYGYKDLARRGLAAHRQHVRLWRTLPDLQDELGPVEKAAYDPRTPEFWTRGAFRRDTARLTHRIKTLYGFFTLVRFVEDSEKRKAAGQSFLYLMA